VTCCPDLRVSVFVRCTCVGLTPCTMNRPKVGVAAQVGILWTLKSTRDGRAAGTAGCPVHMVAVTVAPAVCSHPTAVVHALTYQVTPRVFHGVLYALLTEQKRWGVCVQLTKTRSGLDGVHKRVCAVYAGIQSVCLDGTRRPFRRTSPWSVCSRWRFLLLPTSVGRGCMFISWKYVLQRHTVCILLPDVLHECVQ
jgi:hypothetical protein